MMSLMEGRSRPLLSEGVRERKRGGAASTCGASAETDSGTGNAFSGGIS